MFEHSVKVPRHFKVVANIVKKVSTEGGSVKSLLYDNKLRHFKTNVLYALITETIKHAAAIDKIFENSQLLQIEKRLDPWLAKVLITELMFGKKTLPGQSKPEQTILSYKEQFEQFVSENQELFKDEAIPRPRYVRINTNLLTTSDAIRAFQDEGYHFIRCTSGSYDDYLEQIKKLTEYDFTQDYHIKTIFVFAPGTKWHDHEMYLENQIVLQDKATALAVHLLAAPSGSVCLDMCAAPGMKTTQLAAYMRNEGKIYAVEMNEKRYKTLCDFVQKTECKCVTTYHRDSLDIRRGELDEVEYILLDPSCSGSGMDFCMHSYVEDTRLMKLTSLQEKFLKHAMNAFPKAKRIIYSTCSVYPEENERVVTNVVKTSRAKWRVQDVRELLKGQWKNFGSGMYGSMGTRCLYARPDTDLTTGFFLAVLDRDEKDLAKANQQGQEVKSKIDEDIDEGDNESKKKQKDTEMDGTPKKKKKNKKDETEVCNGEDKVEDQSSKKKKEKRKLKDITENFAELSVEESGAEEVPRKKKKKEKRQNKEADTVHDSQDISNDVVEVIENKPKKKKKRKAKDVEMAEVAVDETRVKKKKSKVSEIDSV